MHSRYCVLRSPTNCWINPTSRQKHKKNTPPNIQKHNTTLFIFSIFYTPLLACGHVENLRTFWYHLRNRFDCGQSFDLWPVIWGNYWVILHHWIHAKDCALAQLDAVLRRRVFFYSEVKTSPVQNSSGGKNYTKKIFIFSVSNLLWNKTKFFLFSPKRRNAWVIWDQFPSYVFCVFNFFFLGEIEEATTNKLFSIYIYIIFFLLEQIFSVVELFF